MVKSIEQAKLIQASRAAAGKRGEAKAVRRWRKRTGRVGVGASIGPVRTKS